MKNIKTLLEQAPLLLIASQTPRLDVELLLCYVLKKNRTCLFTHPEIELSINEHQQFEDLLSKRALQIPVAYLTGQKEFWSLDLKVNEHTLIPRPETELLVEIIVGAGLAPDLAVLDLGTGSGAIALALARERPRWKISAVDYSLEALKIAKENAVKNNIDNVDFFQSDWFSVFSTSEKWDVIVSNPPYLDQDDQHLLTGEIRHEPKSALVAHKNGLADFEKIIINAKNHLKSGGWLLFEHGCEQGEAVKKILALYGYQSVKTFTDMAGLERVTCGYNINPPKSLSPHSAQ